MSQEDSISVITATYNAEEHLPELISSLREQIDKNFEWVIADGASTDKTLELIRSISDMNIKLISQADFGIYDALNRGIKNSSGRFYLVVGADDVLFPNAIKDYRAAIADQDNTDIVTAWVDTERGILKPRRLPASWSGMPHYVSGHAVGSLIKKELHAKYGYYARNYPITADQHFMLKAIKNGASVKVNGVLVGRYNLTGLSAADLLGTTTELARVMISLGFNKYLQIIFMIVRLLKNIGKF